MSEDAFTVTIHMVSSLDGYIAKKDNSVSWFETSDSYEKGVDVTEQDAAEFLKTIDCYVMGSRTYEHALELSKSYGWAYGDTPAIVLTHRNLPIDRQNIEIYSGDLDKLVNERLKPNYKNVWLVGGAMLAKDHIGQEQALHLKDVTAYKSGMVELCYEIRKG